METVNIQEQIHAKQALTLRDIYIYPKTRTGLFPLPAVGALSAHFGDCRLTWDYQETAISHSY